jgi:hypothetical protein
VLLLFNIAGGKHHYAVKNGDQDEAHTGRSEWPLALSRIDSQNERNTGNSGTLD